MGEVSAAIILWFLVSFTVLMSYGKSSLAENVSNPAHLAILLICLPATLVVVIVSLGVEIIDFIKERIKKQ